MAALALTGVILVFVLPPLYGLLIWRQNLKEEACEILVMILKTALMLVIGCIIVTPIALLIEFWPHVSIFIRDMFGLVIIFFPTILRAILWLTVAYMVIRLWLAIIRKLEK